MFLTQTVSLGDTIAPDIVAFSPADDATAANAAANIVITFSEAIQAGAGVIEIRNANNVLVERFDIATSARVAINGTTLTLDPTANLAGGMRYTVSLVAGIVQDAAGNDFAGFATYDFATAPNIIRGGARNDTLNGSSGNDEIYGLGGNDVLTGQAGDDLLDGGGRG